ncbi:MAG: sigma 54-interacting transcriptional regulator [Candidatus Aenigmatarchaeota archaeon]
MFFDEKDLPLIVDELGVGIYVADSNGTTVWTNKVFEDISLIHKEEVIGKTLMELVESKFFSNSATLSIIKNNKPVTVSFNTKTGRKLLSQGKPLFDKNGNLKYVVNTIYDISTITPEDQKLEESWEQLSNNYNIIAQDDKMLKIINVAIKASNIDLPVLICGETGVGKELIAKLIHYVGSRSKFPFIPVNCAAIPESLLESELFGYEPGSFTGSNKKGKVGILELANKGTVFLDEIGDMSLFSQAKLLRFLEEKQFFKIGAVKPTVVDVRVIAATNKNLKKLVLAERFRKDLYYRLSGIYIYLPPLRERKSDIKILAKYFLDNLNSKYGTKKVILLEVLNLLETLPLEGNVRELKNIVERLYFNSKYDVIMLDDFYENADIQDIKTQKTSLKNLMESYEKSIFQELYKIYPSSRKIAKVLNISQASAFKKLKKYNILVSP